METIFDHNITEKEIEFITGFPDTTKEIYLSYRSDWGIYTDLYYLYRFRKNKDRLSITSILFLIVLTKFFLLESLISRFLMNNGKSEYAKTI